MRSLLLLSLLVLVCLCSIEPTLGAKTKSDKKAKPKDPKDPKAKAKNKRDVTIRTPFDKALDKLANCVAASPSLVEVMEENLLEIQKDPKYENLFRHAPHTAAFLKKKKKDSTKFISGLKQSLSADWSNPKWRSADEIETIFRPLKQQLVYTMMRFNCK